MGKRAFRVGDRVVIDNDASIVAIVVAVLEYKAKSYKCAWFHEGTHHTEWFYPDRLTLHV